MRSFLSFVIGVAMVTAMSVERRSHDCHDSEEEEICQYYKNHFNLCDDDNRNTIVEVLNGELLSNCRKTCNRCGDHDNDSASDPEKIDTPDFKENDSLSNSIEGIPEKEGNEDKDDLDKEKAQDGGNSDKVIPGCKNTLKSNDFELQSVTSDKFCETLGHLCDSKTSIGERMRQECQKQCRTCKFDDDVACEDTLRSDSDDPLLQEYTPKENCEMFKYMCIGSDNFAERVKAQCRKTCGSC